MFTQCPKCLTVFRLSAEVLRAAAGEVRCGRCGDVFNALSNLAEDAGAFVTGDSFREQETRADDILRFPLNPQDTPVAPAEEREDFDGSGVQIAHLEITDEDAEHEKGESPGTQPYFAEDDLEDDRSLEFTLPPGELDRIFVEARAGTLPFIAVRRSTQDKDDADPTDTHPIVVPASEEANEFDHEPPMPLGQAVDASGAAVHSLEPEVETASGPEDSIERVDPDELWREIERKSHPSAGGWLAAAIVLALVFVVQWIHHERDSLVQINGVGTVLRSIYAAFGVSLPVPSNLAAIDVRQWGVTGDASANSILRVRASMINTAAEPQPYPLLRVTLADRFGTKIGTRDFEPAEYLHQRPIGLLAAGAHADALVDIADPGKNAQGFEIDVCSRDAERAVVCANDLVAQAK